MNFRKEPDFADPAVTSTPSDLEILYQAVVGPNECDYYVSQFARLDEKWQSARSWNWPAFFLTFPWLIYRKMYGRALLYFLLPYLLVVGIGVYAILLPRQALLPGLGNIPVIVGAILYLIFLFIIVPGLANRQYHRHCVGKVQKARKRSADLGEQTAWLKKSGGTANMFVVGLLSALAFIGASASVEAVRMVGKITANVNQAYWSSQNANQWVSEYYSFHQYLPDTLDDAGYRAPLPKSISDVDYDGHSGALTFTLDVHGVEGKHLVWTPSTPEFLELKWTCSSPDLPDMYLPAQCRTKKKPLLQ